MSPTGWFHFFNGRARENYYTTARFRVLWWKFKKVGPKFGDRWPIRGLAFNSHLWTRFPWLRWALPGVREIEALLAKVPIGSQSSDKQRGME